MAGSPLHLFPKSRKKPKTLSGIETYQFIHTAMQGDIAGKNLKPYQGLKQFNNPGIGFARFRRKKPKTLSGIETGILKCD